MKENRKLSNFFKFAKLSRRYYVRYFLLSLLFLSVVVAYTSYVFDRHTVNLLSLRVADNSVWDALSVDLLTLNISLFLGFFCYFGFMTIIILVIEQRIGGPMQAILMTIEDIKNGVRPIARNLRKDDELQPIMDALLNLANSDSKLNKSPKP